MSNTPAIAVGLTVGLVALVFVSFFLFFVRKKMLRAARRRISPFEASASQKDLTKSAKSSSSSLRTTPPISEKKKQKKKKDRSPSPARLELQAESMTVNPTPKVYPHLTPSDSSGPPIGDASPRSSLDVQRKDITPPSPRKTSTFDEERAQPQIFQPQPQHPHVLIEGGSTTEAPYDVPRQQFLPLSESPSPPPSPTPSQGRTSRSIDRGPGYAPDEDNPGPYPPPQSASQRRGLSRSSRQRSPMRGRGGRSSSSNS